MNMLQRGKWIQSFYLSYLKEMKKQYGSSFKRFSKESYKSSLKTIGDKKKWIVVLKKEIGEGFRTLPNERQIIHTYI